MKSLHKNVKAFMCLGMSRLPYQHAPPRLVSFKEIGERRLVFVQLFKNPELKSY